jgi:hypothetical protein
MNKMRCSAAWVDLAGPGAYFEYNKDGLCRLPKWDRKWQSNG